MIPPWDHDEDLLGATRDDGRPRVRVARCEDTAVVLGRSSRPEVELNRRACDEAGVRVLRRRGGGCAVVLDPGNVIVSATLAAPGLQLADHFARISAWLVDGLAHAGVEGVVRRDVSDLCLGERKIAGACMFRARNLLYYSTSLLVSPDVDLMTRYLAHPPREPAYRRGRTHAAFVTAIDRHADVDAPTLADRLARTLEPPTL